MYRLTCQKTIKNNQSWKKKVRIVMELDKNVVQTACFLANINLSDEVWQKMVAEPILFPTELAGEQKRKWNWEWQ